MASSLVSLTKNLAPSLVKNALNFNVLKLIQLQSSRFLYSKSTLGIDGFEQQSQRTKANLSNISDKFKSKMQDYSADDSQNMIFTEDLKNMVHIAENDSDVGLVIKMMKRFNQQNKELRFGNFVFGPVVMRMFHVLNKPDEALQCFKSPEMQGFFDQLMSYQLLLDLLYENRKYQEMLEAYAVIRERQIEGTKFPRNIVVLTFAACYKLNTPESYKFAMDVWKQLGEVGHLPMRRATTFIAGLAYNQGNFAGALEIVSSAKNQNYTTIRNIKVASLTRIGRIEDTIPILKSILTEDTPSNIKHTFNRDILNQVKEAVEKSENSDLKLEFNRIEKLYKEQGHISEQTLEDQLCGEIATPPFVRGNQGQQQMGFNRYQRFDQRYDQNRGNKSRFQQRTRPGLSELQ